MGKAKLVLGILLLVVGAGVLPTGYVLHGNIESRLDEAIPETLLTIRDEFLPEVAEMVKFEAIAPAALGIRDALSPQIPYLLNGSISVQTINQTLATLASSIGYTSAFNMFFNDPLWSTTTIPFGGPFPIDSISEVLGQSLGFSADAQTAILFGNGSSYPGITGDNVTGSGIYEFLQKYNNALAPLDPELVATRKQNMKDAYDSTWDQLTNITTYINSYLFPSVPSLGPLPFPADESTQETYFLMQWANATLEDEGITLTLSSDVVAWEIGINYDNGTIHHHPSNFTLSLTEDLWNALDPYSPFNYDDGGFHMWYASLSNTTIALAIQDHFNMDPTNYSYFVSYLFDEDFRERVIVPVVEYVQEMNFENVVLEAFYAQWSTGELIPEGISSLGPEYAVFEGFEVALPPTDFYLGPRSTNLWDPNNTLSLTNPSGIQDWLLIARLEPDEDLAERIQFAQINEEFSMSEYRVVLTAEWVLRFRNNILPILSVQSGLFFMHPTEFSNMLSVGGFIAGGVLAFLGVIVILSYRKR
jgi:hypothetical protein